MNYSKNSYYFGIFAFTYAFLCYTVFVQKFWTGGQMEDIVKLPIESIRLKMGWSREEFASKLEVSLDRYNRLATGKSKMLATELIAVHIVSGIPYENIDVQA